MKNIFLVDYENVGITGIENLHYLKEEDEVIIFYSDHAFVDSRKLDEINDGAKVNITCQKVFLCGKNSLDFQLVAYLGGRINEKEGENYFIVSKDKGYYAVILFLQEKANIYQIPAIMLEKISDNFIKKEDKNKKKVIRKIKDEFKITNINTAKFSPEELFATMNKSKGLQEYHNNLIAKYGESGLDIYKKTKKLFRERREKTA